MVQLVITVITLVKGQIYILQNSLIGAVIANTVLMVGVCFILGGLRYVEQYHNQIALSTLLNEMALCVGTLALPVAFEAFADGTQESKDLKTTKIVRAEAILLLVVYGCHLLYSHKSHLSLFVESHRRALVWDAKGGFHIMLKPIPHFMSGPLHRGPRQGGLTTTSMCALVGILALDIAFLGFCATFMSDSLDNLTTATGVLSQSFVSMILLPLLSLNLHAITLVRWNEMSQSFAISISSSMQLLLCVLPLAVILDWMIRGSSPDTLIFAFNALQIAFLLLSLLCLKAITQDGQSNW